MKPNTDNFLKAASPLFAILLLFASSCTSDLSKDWSDAWIFDSPHNLKISSSDVNYYNGIGGYQILTITAQNTSWKIENLPDWLTVDKQQGTESAIVTLTCTANPSFTDARTAQFYVCSTEDDWSYSLPVSVSQVRNMYYASVVDADATILLSGKEENMTLPVESNSDTWTVSVSGTNKEETVTWITAERNAEGNAVVLSATYNPENESRTAYLCLRTNDSENVIFVSQKPLLVVSTLQVSFPAVSRTSEVITVDTDETFEVTTESDWLTINMVDEKSFTLTAAENTALDKRTVTVTVSLTGLLSGVISRSVSVTQQPFPLSNGHECVDLGLPSGLLWATMNVGASSPEDYGDYFAWGETTTKSNYYWSTYKWCNGSSDSLTKYNKKSSYGIVDNKTVLDLSDDAAHVNWGGSWRMPTKDEFKELHTNCTWTLKTQGGHEGYKVTSKSNGNSIFLPAAGCRYDTSLNNAGSYGNYWSSSLNTSSPDSAWDLYFSSSNHDTGYDYRGNGRSVRPVCP